MFPLISEELCRRLEEEASLASQARACTGVLGIHPMSRDIKIDNFSVTFHGVELLHDTKLELSCGQVPMTLNFLSRPLAFRKNKPSLIFRAHPELNTSAKCCKTFCIQNLRNILRVVLGSRFQPSPMSVKPDPS
jgi:hypothetical protein